MRIDTSHLVALYEGYLRLKKYRECADSQHAREYYDVLIAQREREINGERKFLGMSSDSFNNDPQDDNDLLAELMG